MSGPIPSHAISPVGLLVPEEPFGLEIPLPPTGPDELLVVDCWSDEARKHPDGHFGHYRWRAGGRDRITVTFDPQDVAAPVRADAEVHDEWIHPELRIASCPRVRLRFFLEDLATGRRRGHIRQPWIRDARLLAEARQQLAAPPYVRELARPELGLAPGARVHVVAIDIRLGDAIGNLALDVARALRHFGHDVRIWGKGTDCVLWGAIGELPQLAGHVRPGDLIFYQYSTVDDFLDAVLDSSATKVCFYQGITPPELFADDVETADFCRRGIAALPRLAGFDGWIAATSFTAAELHAAVGPGTPVDLVPPTLNLGRFDELEPEPVALPASGRFLLYVGRFAPHKGLPLLVDAFAAYARHDPKCDLVFVGKPAGEDVDALRAALPAELAARVHTVEDASDGALKTLYQASTAYVSASRHEGFCVPLAEALGFGKPVFAYETPSVRETLGGAGCLYSERDPLALAERLREVLLDADALERVLEGQARRARELRQAADGHRLWDALAAAVRRTSAPA